LPRQLEMKLTNTVNGEERRLQYIDKLGKIEGGLFWSVYNHFVILKLEWRIFSEFFRSEPERINLLNNVSGTTALVLQNALRERAVLKVCQITDPAKQGRNRNASLDALFGCYDDLEATALLEAAKSCAKPLRKLRSQSIAHRDVIHATLDGEFQSVSYLDIDASIDSIGAAIVWFAEKYLNTTLILDITSGYSSDEVKLLEVLFHGNVAIKKLRKDALLAAKSGQHEEAQRLLESPKWLNGRKFHR